MVLAKVIVVLITIFNLSVCVDIKNECGDLVLRKVYSIGQTWHGVNECAKYRCSFTNFPKARKERFAVAAKIFCWKWTKENIQSKLCTHVQPDVSQIEFPVCCPMIICVENNLVIIYTSNGKGEPLIVKQEVRNYNLGSLNNLILDDEEV